MSEVVTSITDHAIAQTLQETFADARIHVIDDSAQHVGHAGANGSGRGSHFRVQIASHSFTNLTRLERHRLVYDALRPYFDQGLHALAIETSV